jgi:hypothetical protein
MGGTAAIGKTGFATAIVTIATTRTRDRLTPTQNFSAAWSVAATAIGTATMY